jgi:hypothetical protein
MASLSLCALRASRSACSAGAPERIGTNAPIEQSDAGLDTAGSIADETHAGPTIDGYRHTPMIPHGYDDRAAFGSDVSLTSC